MTHAPSLRIVVAILLILMVVAGLVFAALMARRRRRPPHSVRIDIVGDGHPPEPPSHP